MQFKIDLKIFIFILIFYISGQLSIYGIILTFALIHEIGHLIFGILVGMKPTKMELKPYGFSISFKLSPNDFNKKIHKGNLLEIKKIIVALSGSLMNAIVILITTKLKINIFQSLIIIYSNLILILFNLIPIYPLDGGRILKNLLHICFGKRKAEKYINNISFIVLTFITFLSSILILSLKNISVMFIVVVLWVMYIREDIYYKNKIKIYKLIEKTIEK